MSGNIFDALMGGDMDRVMREMDRSREAREKRNMQGFMEGFQNAMKSQLRPAIVHWLQNGGTHEPRCGRDKKGDLLRWIDGVTNKKKVRLPSVRADVLATVVDGKIEVKGMELVAWLATKLDSNTRDAFIAVRRAQKRKG
jgi:hypothetical protein